MEHNNSVNLIEELSENEKEMLMKVLERYEVDVLSMRKARSAYKIETSKGIICLKRMKHGIQKSKNGSILVEELFKCGFYNTPQYIKTKSGDLFVKYKGLIFYVTEWIEGTECDLNEIEEAVNCVKLLARFHLATQSVDVKKLKINNNLKNWPRIFSSNIYDMEKYKRLIEKKRLRNEFDNMYLNFIDSYIGRGIAALKILNESNYYSLSKKAGEVKTICHDSFYYQNIIKKDEEFYLVDLDSIIIDLHINDLGKMIRRLMFKNEYRWDFEKTRRLIEAYNFVNKLSKEELEAMLALIVFPHKFWKLGKKRYIKHKNWSEAKYMHKLNRLIKYNDMQEKFLEDYLNYIDQYV